MAFLLFHTYDDLLKDKDPLKNQGMVDEKINSLLAPYSQFLMGKIFVLTNQDNKMKFYGGYLRQIYDSGDLQLMTIKIMDLIENLKTLNFKGATPEFKNRICSKALLHMDIWKKLNKEVFTTVISLLNDDLGDFSRKNQRKIYRQEHGKSMRQQEYEQSRVAIMTSRGEITLEFLNNLPYAESDVITVFAPGTLQEKGPLDIEIPSSAGTTESLLKILKQAFPDMKFRRVKSALPSELQCTAIFRSKINEVPNMFLDELKLVAKKIFLDTAPVVP